jgi:hypothetical protein
MTERPGEIHIDELVLDGFPAGGGEAIAGELQGALERAMEGARVGPHSREGVDAGSVSVPHGATPRAAAREVARAVRRGLR